MSVERETAWPSTQLKRCRETRPAKGLLIGVEVVQPARFDARSSSRPDADSRPTRWSEMDSNQRYLAVLPTAQSETPVPPKSATVILARRRERVRHALPQMPSLSALPNAPPRSGQWSGTM